MKQRMFFLAIIVIIMVFSGIRVQGKEVSSNNNDLASLSRVSQISTVLMKNDAKVLNWTVLARENGTSSVDEKSWNRWMDSVKRAHQSMHWEPLKRQEQAFGWQGTEQLKNHLSLKLTYFAYPGSGDQLQTVILYQVSARGFNRQLWTNQQGKMYQQIRQIFHGKEQIFSCVKALDGVKIKPSLKNQGISYLKQFSAAPVEQVNEKTFVSISAYTKTWNGGIDTGKKKMNMQVALRSDQGRTVITIGTPIITQVY